MAGGQRHAPTALTPGRRAGRGQLKRDGTRAETRFRLSVKRTSPFKSAGVSVQSTTGSRGVRISGSNAGYTTFRGSVRVLATHCIRQFPLHFPSRASPSHFKWSLPIVQKAGWAIRQVGRMRKMSPPTRVRSPDRPALEFAKPFELSRPTY